MPPRAMVSTDIGNINSVANSYLRSSEERQAGIRRLAEQMREALGNI